jgi:trimethylamine:corrinoid methyltransferase-like protein
MLSDYIQPPIDPSIDEALKAYMQSRKDSEPDAFG